MSSAVELVLIFIRAGNFFDFHLRSGRFQEAGGDQQRSFAEIFPAGFVCYRILSLRSGANVRRHRDPPAAVIGESLR
jgi:hypothetical protein